METHPVPQQISSYQFRLVGDMTLKQFFQIAGGALISLLIYSTHLYPLIKWPLIIFFTLLGIALAFLPFEERPLERWITAFFRSVYSPTLFFWKKTEKPAEIFRPEEITLMESPGGEIYAPPSTFSKLEETERSFLSGVGQLLQQIIPQGKPAAVPASGPAAGVSKTSNEPFAIPPNVPVQISKPKALVEEAPIPAQNVSPIQTSQVAGSAEGEFGTAQAAQFSLGAAPPSPPTVPNTVVGQTVDETGKIIDGAIIEVRDSLGRPVRALKSNKLGHFMIVTPLQNGTYEMLTEKDGFSFEPVSFATKGKIIPPIQIRGKAETKAVVENTA